MSIIVALMPHGYCFLWNVWLTSLHAVSDVAIAIAYFSIPTMIYWNRDRVAQEARSLVLMFAAFILSCGVGHTLSAWNIWYGQYWIEGTWKVVIAGISLATAWQLRLTIPSLLGVHRELSETQQLASTDALTGLVNRRGLEQALQQFSNVKVVTDNHDAILMLIDIDHFKPVNDTYGHLVGDRVLQEVAQALTRHTRAADIVARLGGDEFAVVLIGCMLPQGTEIAEAIRQSIADISLADVAPLEKRTALVTASIGLQMIQIKETSSFAALFHPVDHLLYVSKQLGRNRVTYQTTEAPPLTKPTSPSL